jgi:hypothetical protein
MGDAPATGLTHARYALRRHPLRPARPRLAGGAPTPVRTRWPKFVPAPATPMPAPGLLQSIVSSHRSFPIEHIDGTADADATPHRACDVTSSLSGLMRRERCCQKADGCKAQSAAHVGHLGKLCNAAAAAFWRNPKGRGAAGALLRCRTCEWEAPFAASSALHRIPSRRRRYRRLKSDRLLDDSEGNGRPPAYAAVEGGRSKVSGKSPDKAGKGVAMRATGFSGHSSAKRAGR